MKFNANPALWSTDASHQAYPTLTVDEDGDVFANGDHIARWLTKEEAIKDLKSAGYTVETQHPKHPTCTVLRLPA